MRNRILTRPARFALAAAVTLVVSVVTTHAQWLTIPDPAIPRLPDGKPNLKAPAPRTADGKPDFSGIWKTPTGKYLANLAADGIEVPMQPWAERMYKERVANHGRDRPSATCLPHSVTDFDTHVTPRKVIQTPGVIVMLYEAYHSFRQIHTDGRSVPTEPEPAWFGYSVGKWEGDTLVVNTVGNHEKTWLDDSGHPHSDALRIIERFRRIDFGHMAVEITIDDPKAYLKPWTVSFGWELMPDTELLDWVCENNKYFDTIPK
jgi:hypothetical protein